MQFEEALEFMNGRLRLGWKLGNDRMEALCHALGDPHLRYPIVHIAGTKGKGSVTALCASVLREAGYKVGSYFSPYVYDVCERAQINGQNIPRETFGRLVGVLKPIMEEIERTDLGPVTEFELKTMLALLYFAEEQVDYAVIEVGLGGRLDATNIVQPTVTAITNIGLDHTEILGDTHALIAREKAGILKQGVPCFTATENLEALAEILQIAAERSVPLARVLHGDATRPTCDANRAYWQCETLEQEDAHTAPVSIATETRIYPCAPVGMMGDYQRGNAALAVALAESALARTGRDLPQEAVLRGLEGALLPGRLGYLRLPKGTRVLMDGAHNPMAATALAAAVRALKSQWGVRRTLLVVGMLTGHNPQEVLATLCPLGERLYACAPDWKRAQPAERIAEIASSYTDSVVCIPHVLDAVQSAIAEAGESDLVLITGSFYTVGEAPPEAIRAM